MVLEFFVEFLVDDLFDKLDGAPYFVIGVVEGDRCDADHVGGSEVGDDVLVFQGAADAPGGLVTFEGDVSAALVGVAGGADFAVVGGWEIGRAHV